MLFIIFLNSRLANMLCSCLRLMIRADLGFQKFKNLKTYYCKLFQISNSIKTCLLYLFIYFDLFMYNEMQIKLLFLSDES